MKRSLYLLFCIYLDIRILPSCLGTYDTLDDFLSIALLIYSMIHRIRFVSSPH
jgi:hypothetical protein